MRCHSLALTPCQPRCKATTFPINLRRNAFHPLPPCCAGGQPGAVAAMQRRVPSRFWRVGRCVYHSLFTVMSPLLDPPLLLFSATTNDPLRCGVDSALSLLQWRGESTLLLWAACSIPASLLKCVYCMHARKREGGRGGGKLLVGSKFHFKLKDCCAAPRRAAPSQVRRPRSRRTKPI